MVQLVLHVKEMVLSLFFPKEGCSLALSTSLTSCDFLPIDPRVVSNDP